MNYRIQKVSETNEQVLRSAFSSANEERKAQLLSLKTAFAQKQCLCGDALARALLSQESGKCELHFARDKNGKPYCDCGLHFNVSHSGDYVLCATDAHPIGADIEAIRTVSPNLKHKVCSADELAWIAEDDVRFFEVWTAKEAYLKYLGIGLRCDLKKISMIADGQLCAKGLKLLSQRTEHFVFAIVYE